MLTSRQEQVLRAVIEEYIATGAPVGSRTLSERYSFGVAPSTIRNDLAEMEEAGVLAHPHTSAGRVPTDAGYRHYVDVILRQRRQTAPDAVVIEHDRARREIDDALRETAEALSQVTEMLAVVSAPAVTTSTIRHIEILTLQPRLVMVVVITSSGQVIKRVFSFDERVDEGLAGFARAYLNERLDGAQLGTRVVGVTFESTDLRSKEREFLAAIRSAFQAPPGDVEGLHLGGTSRLVDNLSREGVGHLDELLEMLEQRYNLLELLSDALREDGVYLRIGSEMSRPQLQSCSLVAANYSVANRALGTVSVLGPTRMNYQRVIAHVRSSADSLSSYLEEIW